MYKSISPHIFIDLIMNCRPFGIVDVDLCTGEGLLIDKSQLEEIVELCTEIRLCQDDLIKRYDVYYRRKEKQGMARVLMKG